MIPKVVINFASSTAYIFIPDGDDEIKLDSSSSSIEKTFSNHQSCSKTSSVLIPQNWLAAMSFLLGNGLANTTWF